MEKIDLDQKLEYKGYWYLPSASDDRVAGVLTYHPNEKIVLELMGCFGEYSWSILTKKKEEPIILGRSADGKDIALINNIQSFKINSGVDFPLVRYTCNFMIIGKHVKSLDEKHHYWATARIPELSLWCQPGALTTTMVFGKNRSVDHVNLSFSTEFRSRKNVVSHVKVDENTGIKVMKGVRYNGDHLAPEIEQFSYLEVRKEEKTSIKELLTDIFMFEHVFS